MGKLTYQMMASLDGYIADADGDFDWGQISAEVHQHANDELKRLALSIYGTRMFDMMKVWETLDREPGANDIEREFAQLWRDGDKIVVSHSLSEVTTSNTRLVRELTADDIARLKAETDGEIGIAGPTLAASFLKLGVIDEASVYVIPVVVGSGAPMFPDIGRKLQLRRIEEQSFDNGVVFIRYAVVAR